MSTERLQKILAGAGVASRRAAEALITQGRVRVNGRIVRELGSRANPQRDRVEVDGKRLVAERPVYYLLHKPRGVVTTLDDPEGRRSVKELLHGVSERVFPVGRLDFHTSGVLLLTNDGDLAQALLHPARAVPKTYAAKMQGQVDERGLELLRTGVVLDDGIKTAPATVNVTRKEEKHTSLEITISEGKNRQIHRMGEAINRTVLRLTRIAFAGLSIEGLRAGQMRPLKPLELSELKQKYLYVKKPSRGRYDREEVREPEVVEAAATPRRPELHARRPRTPANAMTRTRMPTRARTNASSRSWSATTAKTATTEAGPNRAGPPARRPLNTKPTPNRAGPPARRPLNTKPTPNRAGPPARRPLKTQPTPNRAGPPARRPLKTKRR